MESLEFPIGSTQHRIAEGFLTMSERVGDGSRYKIFRRLANAASLIQMTLFDFGEDFPHDPFISVFSLNEDEEKSLNNDGDNYNGNGE